MGSPASSCTLDGVDIEGSGTQGAACHFGVVLHGNGAASGDPAARSLTKSRSPALQVSTF